MTASGVSLSGETLSEEYAEARPGLLGGLAAMPASQRGEETRGRQDINLYHYQGPLLGKKA